MPTYRVCKTFTVESGHMLSKHPGRCRFPHGHTRTIEVVVSASSLDANDMVVDFKALQLAIAGYVDRLDHAMAINSDDPALDEMKARYPDAIIEFPSTDPTTEVLAKDLFDFTSQILKSGFEGVTESGLAYRIPAQRVALERIRVWETPTSWAEYGL